MPNIFVRRALIAAAAFIAVTQIALFTLDMTKKVAHLTGTRPDQAPWALGQTEVEYHRLINSLQDYMDDGVGSENLRLRFDMFYSRVILLKEGQSFEAHRQTPDFAEALLLICAFLDAQIPLIEGSESQLWDRATELQTQVLALAPMVRDLSLSGFKVSWSMAEAQQASAKDALIWNAVQVVLMFLAAFALISVLCRQERAQKLAYEAASQAKARTEGILNSTTDAIVLCDANGTVSEINRQGLKMFQLTPVTALGLGLHRILKGKAFQGESGRLKEDAFAKKDLLVTTATRSNGQTFPAEVSLAKADSAAGSDIYVAQIRDISARVDTEKALRRAHDEAKASERAKSDLLAVMSHETRTPLNGILGAAELLEKSISDPNQRRLIAAMQTSANLLLHHVNNVLDVSRMDSGQDDLEYERFDLEALVTELVNSQHARAASNDIELITHLADDLPKSALGDAQRLRQVLLNLIGNAIKFTEEGSVIVEADVIGEGPLVEFRVIDTGAGIEARELDKIFDDFYTTDSSYARRREGTGLGLGLVKRMVASMGGDVGAESVPGEGSLFWVRLPLLADTVPSSKQCADSKATQQLKILLVEDNEINRLITSQMITNIGHLIETAPDGVTGAKMARDAAYDLILMDISMPGMDGIQTAQQIALDNGASKDAPIVALTAYSREEDIHRVKASGISHVLTKPTSESALEATIMKVTGDVFLTETPHMMTSAQSPLLARDVALGVLNSLGPAQAMSCLAALTEDMKNLLTQLTETRAAEDLDLDEIHRLTGSCGLLGMMKLRSHFIKAERMELGDPKDLQRWIKATADIWNDSRRAFEGTAEMAH